MMSVEVVGRSINSVFYFQKKQIQTYSKNHCCSLTQLHRIYRFIESTRSYIQRLCFVL